MKGIAEYLCKGDQGFNEIEQVLLNITQGKFPFKSVFRVFAEEVSEILAPSYRFFPDTTEQDQASSAMIRYGVQPRD